MKQYFSYFKILFIILGIVAVLTGSVAMIQMLSGSEVYIRANNEAPSQRVYDNAGVLSDTEEKKLTELIAKREAQCGSDIVLVTINESLYEKYGITEDTHSNWEDCMMRYADDFYDENLYGFDSVNGDGALLLDNWYTGEKGSWLSTCGRVYKHYTDSMIDKVLDDVNDKVDMNPYQAYTAYINDVYREMAGKNEAIELSVFPLLVVSLVAAGIFMGMHLKGKSGTKTTSATTYVENGSIKFNVRSDELVNKYITSRVIPRNTSGGGGRSGGGAGGHTSGGGVSHGGGGGRR
ncbi:MAG TPA: TPM domain-containing protein [Lachnospiraceae bacterium]|nr:TPM domain-containing protein [Lachnospiraceae bacterium]